MPRYKKPRPSKPFDGTTCTRYSNDYVRNKVVFNIIDNADMSITFYVASAPKKSTVEFYVADFKQFTAIDVIKRINEFCSTPGVVTTGEWGNHFEDGVLEVWRSLGLPLGWVAPITRMWREKADEKI